VARVVPFLVFFFYDLAFPRGYDVTQGLNQDKLFRSFFPAAFFFSTVLLWKKNQFFFPTPPPRIRAIDASH